MLWRASCTVWVICCRFLQMFHRPNEEKSPKHKINIIKSQFSRIDSRGHTKTDTKAIAPGVTCFTPQKWPTVAVDGALVAESDVLPNKIERSIYETWIKFISASRLEWHTKGKDSFWNILDLLVSTLIFGKRIGAYLENFSWPGTLMMSWKTTERSAFKR